MIGAALGPGPGAEGVQRGLDVEHLTDCHISASIIHVYVYIYIYIYTHIHDNIVI